jgi:TPR repeat protein
MDTTMTSIVDMNEFYHQLINKENVTIDEFMSIDDNDKWRLLYYIVCDEHSGESNLEFTEKSKTEIYQYCIDIYENLYSSMNSYVPLILSEIYLSSSFSHMVKQTLTQAIKYCKVSVELGNDDAMLKLGKLIDTCGDGYFEESEEYNPDDEDNGYLNMVFKEDFREYIKKSAEKGNIEAVNFLEEFLCFTNEEMIHYYKIVIARYKGNTIYFERLGELYKTRNVYKSICYYEEALKNGSHIAIHELILIHIKLQQHNKSIPLIIKYPKVCREDNIFMINLIDSICELSNDIKYEYYKVMRNIPLLYVYSDKIKITTSISFLDEIEELKKRIHDLTLSGYLENADKCDKRHIDEEMDDCDKHENKKIKK